MRLKHPLDMSQESPAIRCTALDMCHLFLRSIHIQRMDGGRRAQGQPWRGP
ncbi:hypothetical protein D187_003350 [Cystobacter fuscus DSM 2262]|uniref:Uncharacterized protein n=1 Tax=Cystobacter fuscus (strain ATCC 25194 / DSM 2262 / NBRC 100088 / M29) TaxID=1242864 RepID=S9QQS9_CYSF2|nr:hypothetical protein D187_003350 [Cystobacter fuscus DSM 2262]